MKKSRGSFSFKRNEKKNCKDNLTPKMPFDARFSCWSTIDFNSLLKNTFREGYDNKFYIKIFEIYRSIDLWKDREGYVCLNEIRTKLQRHPNTELLYILDWWISPFKFHPNLTLVIILFFYQFRDGMFRTTTMLKLFWFPAWLAQTLIAVSMIQDTLMIGFFQIMEDNLCKNFLNITRRKQKNAPSNLTTDQKMDATPQIFQKKLQRTV